MSENKELNINEIILELHSDKATISQVIKNLEKKGMVNVKKDNLDKRKKNISLTNKMIKNCLELKKIEEDFLRDTFEILNEKEKVELESILNKLEGENYEG